MKGKCVPSPGRGWARRGRFPVFFFFFLLLLVISFKSKTYVLFVLPHSVHIIQPQPLTNGNRKEIFKKKKKKKFSIPRSPFPHTRATHN